MMHEPAWLTGLPGLHTVPGGWRCCGICHGGDNPTMLSIRAGDKAWILTCFKGCSKESIARALGIKMAQLWYDWQPGQRQDRTKRTLVVRNYDYVDEHGEVLYQKQRLKPKAFRQRRMMPQGGWAYTLEGGWFRRDGNHWRRLLTGEQPQDGDVQVEDCRRILYHLDELTAWWECGRDPVIWVGEGEKAVDALRAIGLAATCAGEGAGRWKTDHSRLLAPHRVVILPDEDEPGLDHAARVAGSLQLWGGIAKILRLPGLDSGQDVFDWLAKLPKEMLARERRLEMYRLAGFCW